MQSELPAIERLPGAMPGDQCRSGGHCRHDAMAGAVYCAGVGGGVDLGIPVRAARVDAKLAWAGATTVSRNAPLFLLLLAFFAAKQGLSKAEAEAFGDHIFAQTP